MPPLNEHELLPNLDKPEKTKDKKQNSSANRRTKDLISHLSASWRMIFVQRTPVE